MRRKNSKVAIISLKGINTSIPDNTVEDGSCEVLQNMRIKDGAWRNVEPLKFIDSLSTHSIDTYEETRKVVEVLYKHPSASDDSYIVEVEVFHSGVATGREVVNIANLEITHTFFAGEFKEVSVMHLGRLLILNIDGKMSYWKNRADSGLYSEISVPPAPVISLPKKVMRSMPHDFVHTKGLKGVYTSSESQDSFVSYLAPMPIYAYNGDRVYFPIYGVNGDFLQPTIKDDWWSGEICVFAAYKTKDGAYLRPSALCVISSELDDAGEATDREIELNTDDYYGYGVAGQKAESGISEGKIVLNLGSQIITQGAPHGWTWINTTAAPYALASGFDGSVGIGTANESDESVARRCISNALMIAPKIRLSFSGADKDLIDSVAIFATRINSRWDANALSQYLQSSIKENADGSIIVYSDEGLPFVQSFADNKLPEQPFYKVLEIPHSEWGSHNHFDIAITGTLLENAEQKEVWEPINPHELVYKGGKEINSMMHVFGDISQRLYAGYGALGLQRGDLLTCNPSWSIATALMVDDVTYCVVERCGLDLLDHSARKNILSYPDHRAIQMYNGSAWSMLNPYELTSAISNNYAYYTADIFEKGTTYFEIDAGENNVYYCKFPHRWKDTNIYFDTDFNGVPDGDRVPIGIAYEDGALYGGGSIKSLSELRVSALSNPLVFPLSRTYQIGSDDNKIIAVNSAAIELSDEKIGEYPTWVFTTEGVFVGHWGEGDDVIYRAFLPRTYDRICNPNTLAVNGSVLFITQQGLMSIGDRGSQLISSSLNGLWGKTPKWLIDAKMLGWKYDTNEVMIAGPDSDIYVFNLGAGLWTTRSAPIQSIERLLNNEILVCGESLSLYSIQDEKGFMGIGRTKILTRPIKMGEYEMKRIESLVVRMAANGKQPIQITIYGSIDGEKYGILRQVTLVTSVSTRLTRVPMSVRFIKLAVEFLNNVEVTFTSFDIEYYSRFINRLR